MKRNNKINFIFINRGVSLEPPVSRARLSVTPASPPKVLAMKLSSPKRFETKVLKNLSLITPILNAGTRVSQSENRNAIKQYLNFSEENDS